MFAVEVFVDDCIWQTEPHVIHVIWETTAETCLVQERIVLVKVIHGQINSSKLYR